MKPFIRFVSSLGTTVVACIIFIVSGTAFAQSVKDINIALIIPMSGSAMSIFDPAVNSIKMALEEVNAKGFMVGGQKYRLNVHWFDGECKAPVAVNATRAALSQVQPLNMVWAAMCSSPAIATRSLLLDKKVVALNSISGTSKFVGPAGNPYLFKTKEEFAWRTRDLVAYLAKHGLKKGAIVAVNSDWGRGSQKAFQENADKYGIKIVKAINYDEHTEEFVPLLTQVRSVHPDFIFMASELIDEQVAFLRAYKQLGLKIRLAGESTWTEDVAEKAGWDLINGMLTATAWVPSSPRPAVQTYLAKYRKKYGAIPGFNGPPSYDMVYIAMHAFEKAGTLDAEAVRKVLRSTTFDVVYGNGKVKFNDNGQAEFPVSVTMFDASKKMRVLAPGSE